MDMGSIISKKRHGGPKGELTKDEIKYFVGKWNKGEVLDSQAAALFSYIYTNGLTEDEILNFVQEVANSGDIIDLTKISNNIVDKHSTGGVGDKVTLILLPIIAALGLPVAKISSKGYGISGGTIDKLASIPGFKSNISIEEFQDNVKNIGISIVSQDLNLAPVEGKFYKLRNQIGCRDSIVLIAISLMSLKIASGSNKIVFDISCGKGTYLSTREEARRLGKLLVRIGKALNKQVGYVITLMDEPVGKAVGNVLEIKETVKALNGQMTKDLEDTIVALGSVILSLSYGKKDMTENSAQIISAIRSGKAFEKFKQMVIAQNGDVEFLESPDLFPEAKYIIPVYADHDGFIESIDADYVGSLARFLGAGRMDDESKIDNTAGIVIEKKIGDPVKIGEVLAYVHANNEEKASGAVKNLGDAFIYTNKPMKIKSRVLEIYGI